MKNQNETLTLDKWMLRITLLLLAVTLIGGLSGAPHQFILSGMLAMLAIGFKCEINRVQSKK